jgi:hypothetical protein
MGSPGPRRTAAIEVQVVGATVVVVEEEEEVGVEDVVVGVMVEVALVAELDLLVDLDLLVEVEKVEEREVEIEEVCVVVMVVDFLERAAGEA